MLEIYGRKNSNQVINVMWAIGEMGLTHIRHNVTGSFGGEDTEAFGKMNPNRLVPVIDDHGFILWESYAIIRYLCRQYGAGSLWPDDPQQAALADQWMEWTNSLVMPTFFPVFWQLVRTEEAQRDPEKIADMAAATGKLLQIAEQQLEGKQYMVGDTLTMGDIPLGALMFKYFTLDIERPALPNIEAWYQRLQQREAYQTHCMAPFGNSPEEWLALEKASSTC